jgi:hypothetical protein
VRTYTWFRWLKKVFALRQIPSRARGRTPRQFLPRLEHLEALVLPSHFYTVTGFTDGASSSSGGTGTLASPFQYATLRGAINAANGDPGSTITLPAGTYQLTVGNASTIGELQVTASTTITGAGPGSTFIKQTVAGDRVLDIDPPGNGGVSTHISGVTIEGGDDTNSGFTGAAGTQGDGGGGILDGSLAGNPADQLFITNCTFLNDRAQGTFGIGGAVSSQGGNLTVSDSLFGGTGSSDPNTASDSGGAIFFDNTNNTDTLSVTTSTFIDNTADSGSGGGGAISVQTVNSPIFPASATITDCDFVGNKELNSAGGGGGAIENSSGTTVTVDFSRFFQNTAADSANGNVLDAISGNSITAQDDWWASNSGPSSSATGGGGTFTDNNYLVLTNHASLGTIAVGGTSSLTAAINTDEHGTNVLSSDPAGDLPALDGGDPGQSAITVSYSATDGTDSNEQTVLEQPSDNATATFTGTTAGSGSSTATVDGVSVAAPITVLGPPTISTSFGASSIALNSSTTITFTITNPNATTALTGVNFTDTLPSGLVVSTPNGLVPPGSGTVTATAGSSSISLSGASVAAGGSLTFTLNVTGTSVGTDNNTTGAVSSTNGGTGNTASASVTVTDTATHFSVTAPSSATAGAPFSITVTALDSSNNVDTGYAGTVHFTTSDSGSGTVVPVNYTFIPGDAGVHTFTSGVTLVTASNQTVTATDTSTSITGTSGTITVSPAATAQFAVSVPTPVTSFTTNQLTVTAEDAFGNVTPGYGGTVHLTSTDPQFINASGDNTLTNGVGTFNFVLKKAGTQTITATDTVTSSITGTSNTITVQPGAATHFSVSAPATVTAGTAFNFTVTADDLAGNVATGYTGTVQFTTTDASFTLPGNVTLNNGVGTFSATLDATGNETITATDTNTSSITGTSNTFTVNAATATHFSVSAPGSATAGSAFNITLTALDQFNNVATGYRGTVHFTTSDSGSGTVLPANYTFVAGDAGSHTFTSGVTLVTAGGQTVTATDTSTSITGSSTITVSAAATTHFSVSAPGSVTAGTPFSITLTALDQFNNLARGYTGTVHFTTSDSGSGTVLPADYTFMAGDAGSHTFTSGVTLVTAGSQTVTATDTSTSIAGSSTIGVSAAAATHFTVGAPSTATAGSAFSITLTALDQFNNVATGYRGTVHFTTSDSGSGTVLPANYTFVAGDAGVHTFTNGITLVTAGTQTVTATDTTSSITGSSTISVSTAAATHFTISAPGSATAGSAFSITLTALDQFNNLATGYLGTVHFTSTDSGSGTVLPANYTFVAGDAGSHTFTSGVTLVTAGSQTVTATDTSTSITGSSTIAVSAAATTHFSVSAPGSTTAGTPFSVTLTALDQFNNVTTSYRGTVHFTTSDSGSGTVLPADYTFMAGDAGSHTFTSGVTLVTAGSQTVTATDTSSSITGSSTITVSAAAATHFTVSAPASATAGSAFSITLTALDQFNNVATGYRGTVHFTTSDSGSGTVLPANYTFVAGDAGVHTFTNGITLVTAGTQTVTATDTTSSITGSSTISVSTAAATHFTISAPSSATAGMPFSITVTALDQFGNTATGYRGTVHFTTSDSGSGTTVPANYTFVSGDNGVHTFTSGVTLVTAGGQTVTAADTTTSSISGTSGTIMVNPALSIAPTTLVGADAGTLYNRTITVSGGTAPYTTFTVTSFNAGGTGLAAPLVNAAAGTVTFDSTPTAAGTVTFTVNVTDTAGATLTKNYSIAVNPAPSLGTLSLTQDTVDRPYTGTIDILNGTIPFGNLIISGLAGTGLSASLTGPNSNVITITGMAPATAQTINFSVSAVDAAGTTLQSTRDFSITINAAPTISNLTTTAWTQGKSGFTGAMTISNGTQPLAILGTPTGIPTGMTLQLVGNVLSFTGTPTAAGIYNGSVTIKDADGATVTQTFTITINPPLSFRPASLAHYRIDQPYSRRIRVTGGTGAVRLIVSHSRPLPAGLKLKHSPGNASLTILGIPTSERTVTITVRAIDSVGAETDVTYTLTGGLSKNRRTLP